MKNALIVTLAWFAAFALAAPVRAQTFYRRANLVSSLDPYQQKCTVSIIVDGAADVEIHGASATLRDVTGQAPSWQRFDCTAPMPYSPTGTHLRAIEGDGTMTLSRDSYNPGVTSVRVFNPHGGPGLYTFEVTWDNPSAGLPSTSGEADRAMLDGEAIQSCRAAAENQIRGDGYHYVRFGSITMDENGPNDWVSGTATADRTFAPQSFSFTCRVNSDGQVERLDVTAH
jgi:hypothetical protein